MNFQRQREYVTQYAMGNPISKRIPETQQASLKVSAMACQFIQRWVFANIFSLKRKEAHGKIRWASREAESLRLLLLAALLVLGLSRIFWGFGKLESVTLHQ